MNPWMFKLADQTTWPDRLGELYVYDNTHSRQVAPGDSFVYLDKRGGGYAFHRTRGNHSRTTTPSRPLTSRRNARVTTIYKAVLGDFVGYTPSPSTSGSRTREGRRNRARLGIGDVNRLGMSRSVAKLSERPVWKNSSILHTKASTRLLAISRPQTSPVPDKWSYGRRRDKIEHFKQRVLRRQNHTCASLRNKGSRTARCSTHKRLLDRRRQQG